MYKIIGADGKEYGPITAEQLKQWIAEGRANAQTKVQAVGALEWKTLADFPEFEVPASSPPGVSPFARMGGSPPVNLDQVNGPALALMIIAGIHLASSALFLVLQGVGITLISAQQIPEQPWVAQMMSGTLGVVMHLLGMAISGIIFYGGWKMKQLENHGLAVTSSILAIVPCTSPCCFLIGTPIGIWALVVLLKPEIKSAFR